MNTMKILVSVRVEDLPDPDPQYKATQDCCRNCGYKVWVAESSASLEVFKICQRCIGIVLQYAKDQGKEINYKGHT